MRNSAGIAILLLALAFGTLAPSVKGDGDRPDFNKLRVKVCKAILLISIRNVNISNSLCFLETSRTLSWFDKFHVGIVLSQLTQNF